MSQSSPHFAKSVFFGCIDDRLVKPHAQFIDGLGGAFCPTIAGGGLAFISEASSETALGQVSAAYKINHITDVYLESHTDCGAYALSGATFANPNEELGRLYRDLDTAAALTQKALAAVGAQPEEVTIHVRVVDPSGEVQSRPQPPVPLA